MARRRVVKVKGLRELERALAKLPKATGKNVLRRTLKKAGEPIRDHAAGIAPDDPATGAPDLKSSIAVSTRLNKTQRRSAKRAGKSYVEVYIGPGSSVGVLQEFGTAHHGPQAFMRPAWDAEKHSALNTIKTTLGSEIIKAAKRLARKRARLANKG